MGSGHPSYLFLQTKMPLYRLYNPPYHVKKATPTSTAGVDQQGPVAGPCIHAPHPGRSARAPEPRVRAFSKPYGKRGAQSNHVAAEPRPGGNARNARRNPDLLGSQGPGSRSACSCLPSPQSSAAPQPLAPSPRTTGAGRALHEHLSETWGPSAAHSTPPTPLAHNSPVGSNPCPATAPTAWGRGTPGEGCRTLGMQPLVTHLKKWPSWLVSRAPELRGPPKSRPTPAILRSSPRAMAKDGDSRAERS